MNNKKTALTVFLLIFTMHKIGAMESDEVKNETASYLSRVPNELLGKLILPTVRFQTPAQFIKTLTLVSDFAEICKKNRILFNEEYYFNDIRKIVLQNINSANFIKDSILILEAEKPVFIPFVAAFVEDCIRLVNPDICENWGSVVAILLEQGLNPNFILHEYKHHNDVLYHTLLAVALHKQERDLALKLLDKKADGKNQSVRYYITLTTNDFHGSGFYHFIKLAVEKGLTADVLVGMSYYYRPLLAFAIDMGNMPMIELLLEHGADPDKEFRGHFNFKQSPYENATCLYQGEKIVELLEKYRKSKL